MAADNDLRLCGMLYKRLLANRRLRLLLIAFRWLVTYAVAFLAVFMRHH